MCFFVGFCIIDLGFLAFLSRSTAREEHSFGRECVWKSSPEVTDFFSCIFCEKSKKSLYIHSGLW